MLRLLLTGFSQCRHPRAQAPTAKCSPAVHNVAEAHKALIITVSLRNRSSSCQVLIASTLPAHTLPAQTLFRPSPHQCFLAANSPRYLVLRPPAIIMLILPPRHTSRRLVPPGLIPLRNVDRLRGALRSLGLLRLTLLLWWSIIRRLLLVASARAAVRIPAGHS